MGAEWGALLRAAELAVGRHLAVPFLDPPVLLGDAAAVIAQARVAVRYPPAHRDHFAAYNALATQLGSHRLRFVRRTQNLAGTALARGEVAVVTRSRQARH